MQHNQLIMPFHWLHWCGPFLRRLCQMDLIALAYRRTKGIHASYRFLFRQPFLGLRKSRGDQEIPVNFFFLLFKTNSNPRHKYGLVGFCIMVARQRVYMPMNVRSLYSQSCDMKSKLLENVRMLSVPGHALSLESLSIAQVWSGLS